jgi:alkylated DNA repair dioxygenase AlkB
MTRTQSVSTMKDPSPDIVLIDDFLPEHNVLIHRLVREVSWDGRIKARKTASFGVAYDYAHMSYPYVPMHQALVPVCIAIRERLGFEPNNCLLNLYADGSSSMGFHFDATERLAPDTGVAVVSLGAERTIRYRHMSDKTIIRSYRVAGGSLLFMPNRVQHDWLHAVPAEPAAGLRVSLTFRSVIRVAKDHGP